MVGRAKKPDASTSAPAQFVYTDQMRARALARIERKRQQEDPEQVFAEYMHVLFRAFLRRVRKAKESGAITVQAMEQLPSEDSLPPLPPLKSRPGRPKKGSR